MHTDLKRKYTFIAIGIGVVTIVVVGTIYAFSRHAPSYSTAQAERRNLTETVSVSGSVVPDQSVSLTFPLQGTIAAVNVQAGDTVVAGQVLAHLDQSSIQAGLDGALADLSGAQAQLAKIQIGTRPEELAIYQQKYNDAATSLVVAMNNAYLQTQDAIVNKTDGLFTNGGTVNPVINVRTQSTSEQLSIDQERIALKYTLDEWKAALAGLTAASATSSLDTARTTAGHALASAQTFLSDLGTITGDLSTGNSGMSQSAITSATALVNGASQEVSGAANSFSGSDAAWSSARDALTLQLAGSQSQDIQTQEAAVAKAQAVVEAYESQLSQSSIRAPFTGTITDVSMKVGSVVVPGISADEDISIESSPDFKVEGYMPENDLGIVTTGDPAAITFDAYGSGAVFPASVSLIDPAETIVNGANSYKVTLRFSTPDSRIKSGLTANILIMAATATDALAVPTSALVTKGSQTFVLAQQTDGSFAEKPVVTGIVSSDGYTQIVSGIDEGTAIASFGSSLGQ